ncbi:hypothetical protein M5119_14690, partial [Lacticaseibacillus paracasei]|nr:hypothetical protein [Lacticaseibacillus paracasei]MCL4973385.1 hypothetical protein [Lacticaseibacillus paracasei]
SRIMKINGIRADYRQPKKDRQGAKQTYQDENLLNRQFKQEKPLNFQVKCNDDNEFLIVV